jgi:branched-chain amino acid transport system substrate-binding protein
MSTELDRNNPRVSEKDGVSRREFLKIAGVAGAVVGAGAGLGGILAACGGEAETTTAAAVTTTTAGVTTTTAGATTTTAAPATTTVSTAAETGRQVKLGFVTPTTGPLASFGVPDGYCVTRAKEVIGDGIVCGDGLKHPVTIKVVDSQSDPNRAAQVAGDLILNDKVDIILVASAPDNVVPVSGQAEALGTPCLSCDAPWQSYMEPRTGGDLTAVFKWTYHVFFGGEDSFDIMADVFHRLPTNNVLALLYANSSDGNAVHDVELPVLKEMGFTVVDGSGFSPGTEDFTSIISMFKKAGAEMGHGLLDPTDFINFWKQSIQQSWLPKVSIWGKALLFPQSLEAIGPIGYGLCADQWWGADWPYKSALLGETCRQFADDYETRTNSEWTQPVAHFMLFEWAIDVLNRTTSVDDKNAIMTAVKSTNLQTILGPVDFSAPVEPVGPPWAAGPRHIVENVYKINHPAGQWVKGTKWPFDLVTVSNAGCPTIPVGAELQPYTVS